jgi:ribosomal protein L37AE/L43A
MLRPPDRCPNPDCEDSLGGTFEEAQFEDVGDGVWKCRQCGEVTEDT